jgi:rare lipoprotein A
LIKSQKNKVFAACLRLISILLIGSILPVAADAATKKPARAVENVAVLDANEATGRLRAHETASAKVSSGIASWYGRPFHGRKTASGQIYDMNKLTGAHQSLPLCSQVLVQNPHNGKTVLINVNDRGPYIKGRVIDLSHEAARQLGILSCGIAFVNFSVVPSQVQDVRAKVLH